MDGEAFQPLSFTLFRRFPFTNLIHRYFSAVQYCSFGLLNQILIVIMQEDTLICQAVFSNKILIIRKSYVKIMTIDKKNGTLIFIYEDF